MEAVRTRLPTITLSITDIDSKLLTTWKVRAMPRLQRAVAGNAVTSSPSNRIVPSDGGVAPAVRLNSVDLPAPFGPIRPTISPGATVMETSLLATTPPSDGTIRFDGEDVTA